MILSAEATNGEIALHGSSIAICVYDGSEDSFGNCLGKSNQIAIWDTEFGDLSRIDIPQDERAPQCVSNSKTPLPTTITYCLQSTGEIFNSLHLRILLSVAILIHRMTDHILFLDQSQLHTHLHTQSRTRADYSINMRISSMEITTMQ